MNPTPGEGQGCYGVSGSEYMKQHSERGCLGSSPVRFGVKGYAEGVTNPEFCVGCVSCRSNSWDVVVPVPLRVVCCTDCVTCGILTQCH